MVGAHVKALEREAFVAHDRYYRSVPVRYRCSLKNAVWSKFPDPSISASLINVPQFEHVKLQQVL